MYECVYIYIYIYIHICMCAYVCMCVCVCVCARARANAHRLSLSRTHARTHSSRTPALPPRHACRADILEQKAQAAALQEKLREELLGCSPSAAAPLDTGRFDVESPPSPNDVLAPRPSTDEGTPRVPDGSSPTLSEMLDQGEYALEVVEHA